MQRASYLSLTAREVMTVSARKKISVFILILCILLIPAKNCFADQSSTNSETGYRTVLVDEADLLSVEEESELLAIMQDSSAYGNVMFLSVDSHDYSTTYRLAESRFEETFGYSNGVIFVIDMQKRMLWITGMDQTQYIITDNYCDTITDNIYTYASDGDYFTCSCIAFEQIHAVLQGKSIPMPMKYICNFLLSIALALVLNYFVAMFLSSKTKASKKEIRSNMIFHFRIMDPKAEFTHETKVYNPSTSSGGSSGGGGGGGGGGSSGGGHSF